MQDIFCELSMPLVSHIFFLEVFQPCLDAWWKYALSHGLVFWDGLSRLMLVAPENSKIFGILRRTWSIMAEGMDSRHIFLMTRKKKNCKDLLFFFFFWIAMFCFIDILSGKEENFTCILKVIRIWFSLDEDKSSLIGWE